MVAVGPDNIPGDDDAVVFEDATEFFLGQACSVRHDRVNVTVINAVKFIATISK